MRSLKLLVCFAILFTSCGKPTEQPDVTYVFFKATLNGGSVVPANSTTASGTATATYNKSTRILLINIPFSGLTATTAHVHKGAVGVSGAIVFTFPGAITSPINYTSTALDAMQEADLLANLYYVDIHSSLYPGGQIRGQLLVQ